MAGAKATSEEKAQIRDLISNNYRIEEIQSRYPHLDGRVISGLVRRAQQKAGSPLTPPRTAVAPPPQHSTQHSTQPVVQAPSMAQPPAHVPPASRAQGDGITQPSVQDFHRTGFTPATQMPSTHEGFTPEWRQYFIIKKLSPPNEGVMKKEFPPFTVSDLMSRYPAGEYEIQEFRDGRLAQTYREKIASQAEPPKEQGPSPNIQPQQLYINPTRQFMEAADLVQRLQSAGRSEAEQAKQATIQLQVEEKRSKTELERTAITSLIDVVKENSKPRHEKDNTSERLLEMMRAERESSEQRHRLEMERLEKKAQHELMLEKERIKADSQRAREDMEFREKMQQTYFLKLQELETEKQKVFRESYERMIGEIQQTREAINEEIAEKQKWANKLIDVQLQSTNQLIELKKASSGADKDLEVARIVKDGLVAGIDRLGHRFDTAIKHGLIGKGGGQKAPALQQQPQGKQELAERTPATEEVNQTDVETAPAEGGPDVFTDDEAKQELKKPWFKNLKQEILRTLRARAKGMQMNGAMLGQIFIANVEKGIASIVHLHWICSRTWEEVVDMAQPEFSPEELTLLKTEDAGVWFEEFQWFLSEAYNASLERVKAQQPRK